MADVTTYFGNDRYIWQTHTSNDDTIHSGTLRDSTTYDSLGCLTYNENTKQFGFYAKAGAYDECQVDKGGQWLLIKEQLDNANGEDNLIVNRVTGQQTKFFDQAGAPGHSDNGFGYMVGADNWYSLPGAIRVWTFGTPFPTSQPGTPPQGLLVYRTTDWAADIGHLSHANAAPGVASNQQYVCGGNARREQLPRNNEVICFMLDGSLQVLVVAPVMTDLNSSGGSDDYHKQPKGNLDVTGKYFIWTSNVAGSRLDAFIVKVPTQLLTAQGSRPDLIVTALSSPPPAALPGSKFNVTDTVQNQGSGTAGASTTRYLLSTDSQRDDGDTLLTGSRAVPSLVGGASYSGGTLTLTIPSSTPLGTYYLLACTDDAGVVAESDETNNCRRSATTVQVTRPDLLTTAVSNPPASATPGSGFTVTDTIKNQGGVASGASTTRYYLSADQQKGPSDGPLIGSRSVASLAAGSSYSGSALTVTVPSSTPPGTYYLLACADDTAVVAESDEVNNCRASASSVVIGQTVRPDLLMTALSNPPPSAAPGVASRSWTR